MIEEVSGEPFNTFMQRVVLRPLGMTRSTFVLADGEPDVAEFFSDSAPAPHFRFAAPSTSSLYTSLNEVTRFVQAQLPGPSGEPAGRGVLRPTTIAEMQRPAGYRFGFPIYGLGMLIYADTNAGGHITGHDGRNYPAVNTAVRFDPATGDGVVVLQTGTPTLASEVANHWVFWHTGNVGLLAAVAGWRQALIIFAPGAAAIVIVALVVGWRGRRA